MKVVIIDDEPRAIELLRSYLKHFSDFQLIGTFRNGLKALEYLNTNTVDVLFLDINMPHLNGLSLARMVDKDTKVIFTTAYSEHAVESYDIAATDYLLKPISLERFTKAITKLLDSESKSVEQDLPTTIFIKSGLDTHQIKVSEIEHLQKDGNYMHYYIGEHKITTRQNIAQALALLPDHFIQVQKSYIINFNKVDTITSEYIHIGASRIPIGAQFRHSLQKRIDK